MMNYKRWAKTRFLAHLRLYELPGFECGDELSDVVVVEVGAEAEADAACAWGDGGRPYGGGVDVVGA